MCCVPNDDDTLPDTICSNMEVLYWFNEPEETTMHNQAISTSLL